MEKQVQKRLVKFLRSKGCYVLVITVVPGIPKGCPDVIALHEGAWFAFECKAYENSEFQPLQKETIEKLAQWGFAWVVHSDNYDEIVSELESMFD